ncbi:MAG: MFS transporter [Pseudomonadales bacterium]
MTPGLRWYLTSTACFLVPGGIQMVLFPWLVAVFLHESPARVGLAQTAGQLPMLLLILWGGLLGDRVDQRRLLAGLQFAMVVPPLIMAVLVLNGLILYEVLLGWAFVGGCFAAFAQPARDALLNRVAGPEIQRVVTMAVGVQFGVQILGFGIGSTAESVGPAMLMVAQALFMLGSAMATRRIPALAPAPPRPRRHPLKEIGEGIAVAWRSEAIRPAILLTFSVGVFFAGTFMVILPLMVRDIYQGSSGGIALAFIANMAGTCTTIAWLMRRGGMERPGRALMLGGTTSALVLSLLHLELPLWAFYVVIYFWGMCGGISMTMSRSIVQEASPATHRARLMSVYSLGMMGGMPIGSILLGWCVEHFGARNAILVPVIGIACVQAWLFSRSKLWNVRRLIAEQEPAAAG